ncbi:peroxin [Malassezia vespertilionis]|uniref:Pex3p n=1 Tax=Malassezia vespertilionis TaxID=2020962 RepID=A0A2N1JC00_9BASI|nr:peroxin [Malassezia vespertilionis]PKI84069.1 Pex3p [Malassezia vespertilionis]WFD06793.1 peroxin [Malassezia vespertilionis]
MVGPPLARRKWLRRGLNFIAVATGVVGGLYLLVQFALAKFNEMQERMLRERVARENLRRRFLQNQEDCSFTIMALLPTISIQIFKTMDVESTSKELQRQSKKPLPSTEEKERGPEAQAAQAQPDSSESGITDDSGMPAAAVRGTGLDRLSEAPPPPISDSAKLPTATSQSSGQGSDFAREEEDRRVKKLQLWNEIKYTSFARTFTTLYTLVFLAIQTHIQLNLIGRRAYLVALESQARREAQAHLAKSETVDEPHQIALQGSLDLDALSMPDPRPDADLDASASEAYLSPDTEKKYLTSSYWFLHRGWSKVAHKITNVVNQELADMPLKTILTYHHFQGLIGRIRDRIEESQDGGTAFLGTHGFRDILLPESEMDEIEMLVQAGALSNGMQHTEAITPQLRRLLDETKDYIDSPDFARVFQTSCDNVFDLFLRSLLPSFGVQSMFDVAPDATDHAHARTRAMAAEKPLLLAKLLPLVAQQAQVALNTSPNAYVEAITDTKEIRAFSVLIYAAWEDDMHL